MTAKRAKAVRCAVYTRVSTDQGLEQDFNSLDAQYEASRAYIRSQAHAHWSLARARYDDGGFSGGSMERPALQRLLADVRAGKIDVIVVYKVDRLTRSLADFAKLVELFDAHGVSFVSVTQQFNTTTSMGRLTLNVLLSFAQFEREVTSERIRDKIAASKRKGLWVGGMVPMGYRVKDHRRSRTRPREAWQNDRTLKLPLAPGSSPCTPAIHCDIDSYIQRNESAARPGHRWQCARHRERQHTEYRDRFMPFRGALRDHRIRQTHN